MILIFISFMVILLFVIFTSSDCLSFYVHTITGFVWLLLFILSFVYQPPNETLFDGLEVIHKWVIVSHSNLNECCLCVTHSCECDNPCWSFSWRWDWDWWLLAHDNLITTYRYKWCQAPIYSVNLSCNLSHRRTRNKFTEQINTLNGNCVHGM